METEGDLCWICLEDEASEQPLFAPCKCPRKVHPRCLARWQLQQAGKPEEKYCRFCNSTLMDWKEHLTPTELKPEVNKVQPIMVVYFEGQIHRIPVRQGPDGLAQFTTEIRNLFRLPEDVDISLTFGCKEPMSGQHLKLEGTGAFDAAVHCASVAAADRQNRVKKSSSTSDLRSKVANTKGKVAAPSAAGSGGSGPDRKVPTRSRTFHVNRNHNVPDEDEGQAETASGEGPAITAAPAESVIRRSSREEAQADADGEALSPARRVASERFPTQGSRIPPTLGDREQGAMPQRLSSRQITELTDVPNFDETVAVGSLKSPGVGDRVRLQLKAFSRKVVRSLSFTRAPGSPRSMGPTTELDSPSSSFTSLQYERGTQDAETDPTSPPAHAPLCPATSAPSGI